MNFAEALAAGALLGLAGALHCAAMCGVFAVRAAAATSTRRGLLGLGAYVAGKALTYAFLGALAGALGERALAGWEAPRRWLGIFAAACMLFTAWRFLRPNGSLGRLQGALAAHLAPALRVLAPLRRGPFLLGATTGFLPCGLTALAVLQATATASAASGAALLLAFGLATGPALVAAGLLGRGIVPRLAGPRARLLAAALLVAAAAVTVQRAWKAETPEGCCGPASGPPVASPGAEGV